MQIAPRDRSVFWVLVGALPLCALFLEYRLFTLVYSQIGLLRTLGLGTVFSLGVLAIAAVVTLVVRPVSEASRWWRLARLGFLIVAMANVAAVGLAIFYEVPALAPRWGQAGVAAVLLAVLVRVATMPSREQSLVVTGLTRLGLVPVVVTLLAAPVVAWGALTQDRAASALAPVAPGTPLGANPPRHILLVSFDSLRARSTSLHNPAVETPALASLAESSTVFTNCRAAGERTQVTMLTSLTGLPPQQTIPHIHNRLGYVQQGAYTGLAGHLKAAGYRGAYFTMIVGPDIFGMLSEYETGRQYAYFLPPNDFNGRDYLPFREVGDWLGRRLARRPERGTLAIAHEIPAIQDTFRAARAHLAGAPGRSFVWVHIGAPHLPYYDVPAADLGGTLRPRAYRKIDHADGAQADEAGLRAIEGVYQRYVRFIDHEFGRFLDGMRADGRLDDTLVIVMADHGEAFTPTHFPHGTGHLPEAVTHVPLVSMRRARPGRGGSTRWSATRTSCRPCWRASTPSCRRAFQGGTSWPPRPGGPARSKAGGATSATSPRRPPASRWRSTTGDTSTCTTTSRTANRSTTWRAIRTPRSTSLPGIPRTSPGCGRA